MSVIEVNLDPSRKEVKQFGVMLMTFAGVLGGVVLWRAHALVGAAIFLTTAVVVALIFNCETPKARQLKGLLVPVIFGGIGLSVKTGIDAWSVACVLWVVGGLLGVVVVSIPSFGTKLFIEWMSAAEPIGWTISHVILAIAFYLVISPIGLVMRCMGYDPLQRHFDRDATTYWQRRKPVTDMKRYFRQF